MRKLMTAVALAATMITPAVAASEEDLFSVAGFLAHNQICKEMPSNTAMQGAEFYYRARGIDLTRDKPEIMGLPTR
jgi:hypothetical protein